MKTWLRPWAKYFDFKRATVFSLSHRLSKHKTTRYARNFGVSRPLWPPWLRLYHEVTNYTLSHNTFLPSESVRQKAVKFELQVCNN